ncbi:MAG: dihydroorotase [Hyphomonas sp.]
MDYIIENARLLDPATGRDEMGAIHVQDGLIAAVSADPTSLKTKGERIDAGGLCLAPGLIDMRVKTGEPGDEYKETLATASKAALSGGVTSFVVMPDTQPVIDGVALIRYIEDRARDTAKAKIYPAGGLTVGLKGEAMAEIGLMSEAGAVFFTNGDKPVSNASILKRTMSYAASRNATIMSRPDETNLTGSGVMNAGTLASRLGLSGMPAEAEWIGAARDLTLAEATGCRLIVDQASTPRTLELIAAAKSRGANVFTTIAAYSLYFNEADVDDYLTYCKVNPPFRDLETRDTMIAALKAGEIDAVVSAHDPQPPEEKRLPFSEAAFGAAGLETTLSALLTLVQNGALTLLEALAPVTNRPADILSLPQGRLGEGTPADLILFDPDKPWYCEREDLLSRSLNSPFDGKHLQGRVMRTFIDGVLVASR